MPAASAGTLDQSQEDTTAQVGLADFDLAQTFTSGRTGALDQVDLHLERDGTPGPLVVAIRDTSGGVPTLGPDLVSETIPETDVTVVSGGDWVSVPLDPPLEVSSNTTYAIVLRSPSATIGNTYWWSRGSQPDPYAGGTMWCRTKGCTEVFTPCCGDAAFRTYVNTARPDLGLSIGTSPNPVKRGKSVTYTITVQNFGLASAPGVVVTDVLPSGAQFVSAQASQGSCTTPAVGQTGTVTCTQGSLGIGSTSTVQIVAKIVALKKTTVSNTASATTTGVDSNPANNSATASVVVK